MKEAPYQARGDGWKLSSKVIDTLIQTFGGALLALALASPAASAPAGSRCRPDALGVSRTIAIGGNAGQSFGLKTYPQTLDLQDGEVVLTFDDGPTPSTRAVLDALAQECVKATFFLIGRNAAALPALARREIAEGHTIGHHSFSHPSLTLRNLPFETAMADIDKGIAADDKAAGVKTSRFFRFPGFGDSPALLDALAKRGMPVFGADFWASDWLEMTPEAELKLVMDRLKRAHSGIILFHDTRPSTVAMLPAFLRALKTGGYRIVHLAPGAAPAPTRPAPEGWRSETEATLQRMWPKPPPAVELKSDAMGAGATPVAAPAAAAAQPKPDNQDSAPAKAQESAPLKATE